MFLLRSGYSSISQQNQPISCRSWRASPFSGPHFHGFPKECLPVDLTEHGTLWCGGILATDPLRDVTDVLWD